MRGFRRFSHWHPGAKGTEKVPRPVATAPVYAPRHVGDRRQVGQASYRTTERYLHHSPAIEDAAKLTAAFGGEGAQNAPAKASTPTTMNRPHIATNA
jgi:hypothetical protein